LPSYGNEIKSSNIVENWLFHFSASGDDLYLSFKDVTDSNNFYYGVILNKPSIRESIDLTNSTSSTSSISVTIPDFTYKGSPISKELFGGSNKFINQNVAVYSQINGNTKQQIGSFRLTDISSNGEKINLSLSSRRPWDYISSPQVKSDTNTYIPISYGVFTPNTCRHNNYAINDSLHLFPVPVDYITTSIHCIVPRSLNGNSNNEARLHYWDKTAEQFCPLLNGAGTGYFQDTSIENNNINYTLGALDLHRGYMAKPLILKKDYTAGNFSSWSDTDNIGNAVDDRYNTPSTSTFTSTTLNLSITGGGNAGSVGQVLFMSPLTFEGVAQYIKISTTTDILSINQTGNAHGVENDNISYNIGMTGIQGLATAYRVTSRTTNNSTFGDDGGQGILTEESNDIKNSYNNGGGWTADDLSLVSSITLTNDNFVGSSTMQAVFRIYDVVQTVRAKYEDQEAKTNSAIQTEYLYLGCNGLSKSYSGGSGSVLYIHEAHRDLINQFTGVDASDSNIDGWSSLNSSRTQSNKEWKIRYWQLEPSELKSTLEKLQYEGGFIFRFKADGNMQYVHIPDSPSSSATLTKKDISNVKIKPSSFSSLLTKMDINYEKHPAENKYLTNVASSDSTARSNWNISTKENIKQVNLDAYVAPTIPTTPSSNPNDDFYSYYHNIQGDIFLTVDFVIVNPKYYNLEVGDIIDFSNMYPETPFGYNSSSWSGLKFMITNLQRSIGKINITSQQI